MSKKGWKTAEEVIAEQNSNPEFVRRRAEKEQRRKQREKEYAEIERPIVECMRAVGFEANSIIDAIQKFAPLPDELVAVLLQGVTTSTDIKLLEWLIRALAAARNPFDGRPLVECYAMYNDCNLRWVIANTIGCAKPLYVEDWVKTALQDEVLGKLLRALGIRK